MPAVWPTIVGTGAAGGTLGHCTPARLLALTILGDEPQPLGRRLGERHARLDRSVQGPATGVFEHRPQLRLSGALREVAGRWPTVLGPGRPELRLHLLPAWHAVLHVPDRTVLATRNRWPDGTPTESRNAPISSYFSMPPVGFEPTTFGLKVRCSTS